MSISICMATIKDLPQLLPLLEQLGYPTNFEELERRWQKLTSIEGYGVAVARLSEGNIIGLVAWSRIPLFTLNKTRFHIEALVVGENYRSKGIGEKLILFVEEIAKTSIPAIIDLTSGVRRAETGSHRFYQNLGYKNEGLMAKLYLRKEAI